jgi:SAM-dependent methyltransferase
MAARHFSRRLSRQAFDKVDYWDSYYAGKQAPFEWYFKSSRALLHALGRHGRGARCLEIGCGTSALGHALEAEGFDVQYCDFSETAIDFWRRRLGPAANARYHVADVRALPFGRGSFAVGVEKGCLDALAFGTDARQPTAQLARALDEIRRVLQPGGTLYSFSTDPPELRLELLRDAGGPDWRTTWRELEQDDQSAPPCEPNGPLSARGSARGAAAPCFMYVCSSIARSEEEVEPLR